MTNVSPQGPWPFVAISLRCIHRPVLFRLKGRASNKGVLNATTLGEGGDDVFFLDTCVPPFQWDTKSTLNVGNPHARQWYHLTSLPGKMHKPLVLGVNSDIWTIKRSQFIFFSGSLDSC